MKKSGLADSPFFTQPVYSPPGQPLFPVPHQAAKKRQRKKAAPPTTNNKPKQKQSRDTKPPRNHATTTPWLHATIIEAVRKAVKELGKEAATHRFTRMEKKTLADLIYKYKDQGLRTSENEITRIAVNFILKDHQENGKQSVLDKILRALHE